MEQRNLYITPEQLVSIMEQRNLYITPEQLERFCNKEVENYNSSEDKSEIRVKLIKSIERANNNLKTNFFIFYIPFMAATAIMRVEEKDKKIAEDFFFRLEKFIIENGKEAWYGY